MVVRFKIFYSQKKTSGTQIVNQIASVFRAGCPIFDSIRAMELGIAPLDDD
jgi:hypothetical protein